MISDLAASRTVRSRCLSFEPPAAGTQLQQPQLTKTVQEEWSQGLGDGSLRHSQSEIQMLLKTRVGQPLTFPELSMSRPTPEATSCDDSGRGRGAAGWVGGTFLVCGAAPPCCSAEPAWPRVHPGGGFGAQAARGAPGSGVGQWMRHDLPSLAFCVDPPPPGFRVFQENSLVFGARLKPVLVGQVLRTLWAGGAPLGPPADPEPPLPVLMPVMPCLRCPAP